MNAWFAAVSSGVDTLKASITYSARLDLIAVFYVAPRTVLLRFSLSSWITIAVYCEHPAVLSRMTLALLTSNPP